jgi:hypothetical protein
MTNEPEGRRPLAVRLSPPSGVPAPAEKAIFPNEPVI